MNLQKTLLMSSGLKMMKYKILEDYLDSLIPNPKCELDYFNDYSLLIAIMLSAQTTDKRVNLATKELFLKYDTLEKLNTLSTDEISSYIKSIGFHHTKAKNFKSIVEEINKIGFVPDDRDYLERLPGVGRKTASVVLGHLYN